MGPGGVRVEKQVEPGPWCQLAGCLLCCLGSSNFGPPRCFSLLFFRTPFVRIELGGEAHFTDHCVHRRDAGSPQSLSHLPKPGQHVLSDGNIIEPLFRRC